VLAAFSLARVREIVSSPGTSSLGSLRTAGGKTVAWEVFMIRLPILKDEVAFLEKHLPELEERADLGHVATEFKKRIMEIRQQIYALQENAGNKSK
jgi:hypothetical protein